MLPENDKDIKVFHPSTRKSEALDVLKAAQELDAQRANGNLARARQLGAAISSLTPSRARELVGEDTVIADPEKLPSNVIYQARVLLLFAAQLTLHSLLPTTLSSEAVNSMYDHLSEGFYDNIMDGTSFSFYYLAVRKSFNVEENIGKSFAMLCGDEDSDEYAEMGRKIYSFSEKAVGSLVKNAGFEE